MEYTAEQIDAMEIEEIESLAGWLSEDDKNEWAEWGYSGEKFVELYYRR